MKIWVDLSNSPHALLFRPIVARLEELGHEVVVTARDNAQTVELARPRFPELAVIGGESPGGKRSRRRRSRAASPRSLAGRARTGRILRCRTTHTPRSSRRACSASRR